MYQRLEAMGTKLLGLFVPQITAAAAVSPAACRWKSFSSCWQCGYSKCCAYCCDGQGCSTIICNTSC